MNPAYSVILFTTASGAGYGLLALLGLASASHGVASSRAFAFTSLIIALALITVGLLSSTLHLGHPERAWRAFSQWRSSWLSREGVAAVVTYPIAFAFGAVWSGVINAPALILPLGLLTAVMCAVTVYCTGMIYQSLRTIRQWNTTLTTPIYLAWAVMTGAALLCTVMLLFGRFQAFAVVLLVLANSVLMFLKYRYWHAIDASPRVLTTGKATGLGENVRQWEVPHTATNFVQKEMGFVVARKHAQKLRMIVQLLLVAVLVAALLSLLVSPPFIVLAAPCALMTAVLERWLFFAEAEHVSMLYYDREAA
jgi:sulfite dehydrogenase (quinone) subunit SoeC